MAKIMLFIDGTWLYANQLRLAEAFGNPDYHVDFGRLPGVLAGEISRQLGGAEIDVVRSFLFGSYAANYDLRDDDDVQRRLEFFAMLKEEYHYELEIFPVNFMGRRLRQAERAPKDTFVPKEKCVDIALATSMLFYAAIPFAYDIAVAVIGDQDFKPMLQHVRRLGKRVAIASIRESCAPDFSDPRDQARVKDFDIIWVDDLLEKLELKYEPHQLECQSPAHTGDRKVWTTFHPRKGQRFYCDDCRAEFARQKEEAQRDFVSAQSHAASPLPGENGARLGRGLSGAITHLVSDRGFGFIRATDGHDYFFHLTDLQGLDFAKLAEGMAVGFDVKKDPGEGKAGAAQNVRIPAERPLTSG